MAAKTVQGTTGPGGRLRRGPGTVGAEAGDAVETGRSESAVLRRCAEARGMSATPEILAPLAQRGRRSRSPEECAKYIQREMSRALPQIWEMLLTETTEHKNLAALKMMLQVTALYSGRGARAGTVPSGPMADVGFARRMVEEFRRRSAVAVPAEKEQIAPVI